MKQFERRVDDSGEPYMVTDLPGFMLTRLPLLNKSTAFSPEERQTFGLEGLLPPHVATLQEQITRTYGNYQRTTTNIDKHVYLRNLQDRNEVLFYAVLEEHLEEMMPIVYTPTVAEAVQRFSHLYRYARGLVISTENIDRVDEVLGNTPMPDVRLAVVTDSEGILGIGDQGYGGMGICIGKLSLYTAAAGIDPAVTLPIELDVGTNRADLLDDPLYLGVRHERLTGQQYDDFVERFVTAFKRRFPAALLQWEDFSKQKAFTVLERFRDELPSFNDDIQGTGAVTLAGLLAATRRSKRPLTDEVILVHGAGAGGVGVAMQVTGGLIDQGLTPEEARRRVLVVDSRGLVVAGRKGLEPYKEYVAQAPEDIAQWWHDDAPPSLLQTVEGAGVTVLLGLSGQGGAFAEDVVRAVARNSHTPVVFAMSNPTENSEATPEEVYRWTDGRAIVATGSPFPEVEWKGGRHPVGQANNAFIFPGLGLGAMLSRVRTLTPGMFRAAAQALAEYTDPARIAAGAVYPSISSLRRASRHVAIAVVEHSLDEGSAQLEHPGDVAEFVTRSMWEPRYVPIRRA
ncbi:MAG TPA: NAD-dependent malic enzyme [Trueperaceae bacterium]